MTDPATTNDIDTISAMSTETLAALFRHATHLMARMFHMQGYARHAQSNILNILGRRNSISQRELLEELNVRSASLSELLAKLERGGLITRQRDEKDKRSFIITITEQGKAAGVPPEGERSAGAEMLFAPLSAGEKRQLGGLLVKLIIALEEQQPDMARSPRREHGRHGCERLEHPGRERGHHGHERHEQGHHRYHEGRHCHEDGPDEAGRPGRGPGRSPRERPRRGMQGKKGVPQNAE